MAGRTDETGLLIGGRSGKLSPGRPLISGGQAAGGCIGDFDSDGQADLAISFPA